MGRVDESESHLSGSEQLESSVVDIHFHLTESIVERSETATYVEGRLLESPDGTIQVEHHAVEGSEEEHDLVERLLGAAAHRPRHFFDVQEHVPDRSLATDEQTGNDDEVGQATVSGADGR